jgi:hypothetical protein
MQEETTNAVDVLEEGSWIEQIAATAHKLAGNARAPSELVARFKLAN